MKFEAVTIKDIARALGLSPSTVSRALRGSYEISPETKQLVQDYARKFNYQPNPIAKSLKESRSRAIGVIVPEIVNYFFSQAINGIDEAAYQRGYHVIVSQSHESFEREVETTQLLVSRRVDGLLVSLSSQTDRVEHFKALQEKGLPIVFFDRVSEEMDTCKVKSDNFQGSYQATAHLAGEGCRRIAHLTTAAWLSITRERLAGYRKALEDNGLPFEEAYVKYFNFGAMNPSETDRVVGELLKHPERPDAIFSATDRLTSACLASLRAAGVRVPHDIALVGFTNLTVAHLLDPALTCVTQPAFEMGQAATEMLIGLIESKRPVTQFETRVLPTTLWTRASSRKDSPPVEP
jgi:LacI family transcriptional regulator